MLMLLLAANALVLPSDCRRQRHDAFDAGCCKGLDELVRNRPHERGRSFKITAD